MDNRHTEFSFSEAVGFTARLSTDTDYSGGDTVLFDDVISNLGNRYDPATGLFTCPFRGMYGISLYVFSQMDKDTTIKIVNDGNEMVRFWADGEADQQLSNGVGGMIVVECDVGKTISAVSEGSGLLDGGSDGSLFSVALIHRI